MSLSENEKLLFDFLQSRLSTTFPEQNKLAIKAEVSLDEIITFLESEGRPAVSRHAAVVRMKYLASKIATEGWIIEKNAARGRGAKAVYTMTKRF